MSPPREVSAAGDHGVGVVARSPTSSTRSAATWRRPIPRTPRTTYRQVLALAPSHADAHVNLGRLLHEAGELGRRGRTIADRAQATGPDDATATFNLAVAIEDQGRYDEALKQYERAVAIDGKNADAHYNAARLYEKTGEYTAAVRHLRAYRELVR